MDYKKLIPECFRTKHGLGQNLELLGIYGIALAAGHGFTDDYASVSGLQRALEFCIPTIAYIFGRDLSNSALCEKIQNITKENERKEKHSEILSALSEIEKKISELEDKLAQTMKSDGTLN